MISFCLLVGNFKSVGTKIQRNGSHVASFIDPHAFDFLETDMRPFPLLTLLEEILANREKTLVFSQYVETLDCLEKIIKSELGEQPLIYHGGLSQSVRSEIINRFQNESAARILLISLRAGGLGLNLTSASRVIHYDLWYNPAVENQATDRAFRIGQKRNVFVHRFITKNSFEEKIDAMITSKRELADMTITSGESWIARMSHEELKELFER